MDTVPARDGSYIHTYSTSLDRERLVSDPTEVARDIPHVDSPSAMTRKDLMNVILYTRKGCHLCDDALELLEGVGLKPMLQDIDADPELRERFDVCVPVVEIDGKIRFRGKVDPVLLKRLLTHNA